MKFTREELEKWYVEDGLTQTEIGAIKSCDRKLVDYYMRKYGIKTRTISEAHLARNAKLRGKEITFENLKALIDQGMLIGEIAQDLSVSRRVISDLLHRNGINMLNSPEKRRRQSERMKTDNPVKKGMKRPLAVMRPSIESRRLAFIEKANNIQSFRVYAKSARYLAYHRLGKGALTPEGMVIDHLYSVRDGFENGVPVEVISHPFNLRFVTPSINLHKGAASLITLDELYAGVGVQRLSKPGEAEGVE